jgi:hypothetical protein
VLEALRARWIGPAALVAAAGLSVVALVLLAPDPGTSTVACTMVNPHGETVSEIFSASEPWDVVCPKWAEASGGKHIGGRDW